MAKVLKQNVVLRDNPPVGLLHAFVAGQTLPAWAEEQVKNSPHLFNESGDSRTSATQRTRAQVDAATPKPKKVEKKPVEEELEVPKVHASKKIWFDFAKKAYGLDVDYSAITRDEIVEKVKELDPDLEIPED